MTKQSTPIEFDRRDFLKASAAMGGLALSLYTTACSAKAVGGLTELNAWIRIAPDNRTTITVSQSEMGQGAYTTLSAIIAEELDADWALVDREFSPVGQAYANPRFGTQFTGNAESVRTFWPVLRHMGASAREMLVSAAARSWNVDPASCRTENSHIYHDASNRVAAYGDIAEAAADIAPPETPRLKAPADWTLLRRSLPRVELEEKVTGAAVFGIDVELDGMVHGAIMHAPTQNGVLASVDKESVAGLPGVIDVVELPNAVIVVADTYWRAQSALNQLEVTFTPGAADNFSTDSLNQLYRETMDGDRWSSIFDHGNAQQEIDAASDDTVISAEYWSAWQSHSCMEPINLTAHVVGDTCRIVGAMQGVTMIVVRVAEALGIPQENITVDRVYLGGGFGRKGMGDFARQAALASRAVGRPVKLTWSREEDTQHDYFRPGVMQQVRATLGSDGLPSAMDQKLVTPTILSPVLPVVPEVTWAYPDTDDSCIEGLTDEGFRYGVPANRLDAHILSVPARTMVWRTTGYGPNVFAIESFIDEMAHKAGQDPHLYRRTLLGRRDDNERAVALLDRLAEASSWGSARRGRFQGMAISHCFDSYVGQVIEISLSDDGVLDIHRVVCVLDAGYVLDPDMAAAQIEGGVVWGLGQALISEITFANGQAEQSNFHDYQILTLPETPPVEIHYIDSGAAPGGVGEVGPVPVTPALANAIFAGSGRRLRSLPLSQHGIFTRYAKQFN